MLKLDTDVPTTSNLVDLADDGGRRFGNLGGKMAVIYADGNGFGGIKRGVLDDHKALHDFDTRVQTLHKVFLRDLVESARNDEDFHNDKDFRLEVLLWGGDELMLVTPAWKGMETLQRFFETVEAETPANDLAEAARQPTLTYAAGLVFCSANTPIAEIVRTAKQLAEAVKGVEHSKNRFDYLVLESVDYPTQGIEQFRRLHFGANASEAIAPLAPLTSGSRRADLDHAPWPLRIRETAAFLDRCPRGAIRDLAQHWVRMRDKPRDTDSYEEFQNRVDRFLEVNKRDFVDELYRRLFDHLVPNHAPALDHDHAGWLHLTELWDYLAPLPSKAGRTAP